MNRKSMKSKRIQPIRVASPDKTIAVSCSMAGADFKNKSITLKMKPGQTIGHILQAIRKRETIGEYEALFVFVVADAYTGKGEIMCPVSKYIEDIYHEFYKKKTERKIYCVVRKETAFGDGLL